MNNLSFQCLQEKKLAFVQKSLFNEIHRYLTEEWKHVQWMDVERSTIIHVLTQLIRNIGHDHSRQNMFKVHAFTLVSSYQQYRDRVLNGIKDTLCTQMQIANMFTLPYYGIDYNVLQKRLEQFHEHADTIFNTYPSRLQGRPMPVRFTKYFILVINEITHDVQKNAYQEQCLKELSYFLCHNSTRSQIQSPNFVDFCIK